MSIEAVYVKILDKEFQVACPPGERAALMQAALNLDHRMRNIRKQGNVIGLERIAIMAALNMSHELLQMQQELGAGDNHEETLTRLTDKVDQALQQL